MIENKNEDTVGDNKAVDYWSFDRVVTSVPIIHFKKVTISDIYHSDSDLPDWKLLKSLFQKEAILDINLVTKIIEDAKKIFSKEPNLLNIAAPITICGDIHGQYFDLIRLFDVGGSPEENKYLFLGDYVDRGYFSCEVTLLLYCLKINYPDRFFMLRGNHECKHLTEYFTFKTECKYKYDSNVYKAFCDSFCSLPLAAVVSKQFLCVHGGISPELKDLNDINKIDRFKEPPSSGLFCDLLWSDPIENFGNELINDLYVNNPVRGCSYYFTYKACCDLLQKTKLLSIIRAHEAQDAGMYKKSTSSGFPSLITIFSAPNYLDVYNNSAAILKYDGNVLNIKQFKHSPHPYWLPNFMNVFSWSVPFVGEKVMEILEEVLKNYENDEEDGAGSNEEINLVDMKAARREQIKNKIRAVGKINHLFSVLREEGESVLALKGLTANGLLPSGILSEGRDSLKKTVEKITINPDTKLKFDEAREIDLINERLPPPSPTSEPGNTESDQPQNENEKPAVENNESAAAEKVE